MIVTDNKKTRLACSGQTVPMRTKRAQKRTFKKQKGKEKKKKIGYAFISLRGGIWCHLVARNVSGRSEQTEAQ